ncbi:MAG: FliM/FliN family flagellar motor switch protein, partial [Bauldia sp.]
VRFMDYIDSIPLPAMLGVFRAEEWDNFGLISADSNLIYSIIDVLLGGGRSGSPSRMLGRPHTTIENSLVSRLFEILLADAEQAFRPVSPVSFKLERLETNPRFAAIARPANAAILVQLRVGMDDRGGKVEILLPYATIEPIRDLLLQMFMGEKFGRDAIWEGHLATEIHAAEVDVDAVLFDSEMPLRKVMDLKAGQTLLFENTPQDPVSVRCGDVPLAEGLMGRRGSAISVRVVRAFKRSDAHAARGSAPA